MGTPGAESQPCPTLRLHRSTEGDPQEAASLPFPFSCCGAFLSSFLFMFFPFLFHFLLHCFASLFLSLFFSPLIFLSLNPISPSSDSPLSCLYSSPHTALSCPCSGSQHDGQQPRDKAPLFLAGSPSSDPLATCSLVFLFRTQAQRGPLQRKLGCLRCRLSAGAIACQLAELGRTVWSAQDLRGASGARTEQAALGSGRDRSMKSKMLPG